MLVSGLWENGRALAFRRPFGQTSGWMVHGLMSILAFEIGNDYMSPLPEEEDVSRISQPPSLGHIPAVADSRVTGFSRPSQAEQRSELYGLSSVDRLRSFVCFRIILSR